MKLEDATIQDLAAQILKRTQNPLNEREVRKLLERGHLIRRLAKGNYKEVDFYLDGNYDFRWLKSGSYAKPFGDFQYKDMGLYSDANRLAIQRLIKQGMKVGSEVEVISGWVQGEGGANFYQDTAPSSGRFKVRTINDTKVRLSSGYTYPGFCLQLVTKCKSCNGTGKDNVPYGESCDDCSGKGTVFIEAEVLEETDEIIKLKLEDQTFSVKRSKIFKRA